MTALRTGFIMRRLYCNSRTGVQRNKQVSQRWSARETHFPRKSRPHHISEIGPEFGPASVAESSAPGGSLACGVFEARNGHYAFFMDHLFFSSFRAFRYQDSRTCWIIQILKQRAGASYSALVLRMRRSAGLRWSSFIEPTGTHFMRICGGRAGEWRMRRT